MEKEHLKQLQKSRILNMSDIYRDLGEEPAYFNNKLGRPRSHITKKQLAEIERQIIERIKSIIDYAEIPLDTVIPRLLTELTPEQARKVFEGMEAMAVEPIGYIEREDAIHALYLPQDQYRPRNAEHNATPKFMALSRMMSLPGDLQLTDRGRSHMTQIAEGA